MYALIYTTNTGSTKRYAELLAQEAGPPVCSLAEAKKIVPTGAEVIYLGRITAGAAGRHRIRAVCAVGMGQTGTQTGSVRKKKAVHSARKLWCEKAARPVSSHDGDHGQGGR